MPDHKPTHYIPPRDTSRRQKKPQAPVFGRQWPDQTPVQVDPDEVQNALSELLIRRAFSEGQDATPTYLEKYYSPGAKSPTGQSHNLNLDLVAAREMAANNLLPKTDNNIPAFRSIGYPTYDENGTSIIAHIMRKVQ